MQRLSKPIELERAQQIVAAAASRPLPAEDVLLTQACGRVLSEPLSALADVPPFASSAMDGFAVRSGEAGRRLAITGEARAGAPSETFVEQGAAVRIATGAVIPEGAQAVIQLEACTEEDGREGVLLEQAVAAGRNIRAAGEDMRAGAQVLAAGVRLGPVELAVAVGAGPASVRCARRPRVAILTTGDELRPPGAALLPGQIHNSNALALASLAREAGAELPLGASVGDDPAATRERLAEMIAQADVLLIAGGVSVGPHDHVKQALGELGCRELFWGVSIRPGKPTWFGESGRGGLVFGLPGNPVSAIVIFMLLVRPALAALQGARPVAPDPLQVQLAAAVTRDPDRTQAVRVKLESGPDGSLRARPTGEQGSHVTTSLLGADALALIAPGAGEVAAGAGVEALPIR